MRKRLAVFITAMSLVLSACGNSNVILGSRDESQDTTSISLHDSSKDEPPSSSEAPHVHEYDEGKVTKAPTCEKDGVMTYTCACGDTKTEPVPATGHDYQPNGEVDVHYVPGDDGIEVTTQVCQKCGDYADVPTGNKVEDKINNATTAVVEICSALTGGGIDFAYGEPNKQVGEIRYQFVTADPSYSPTDLVSVTSSVVKQFNKYEVLAEPETDEDESCFAEWTWEVEPDTTAVVLEAYAMVYNANFNVLQIAAYEADIRHTHEFVPGGEDIVVTPATLDTPATAVTTKTSTCDCGEVMTDTTNTFTDAYTVTSAVNGVLKGYGIVDAELKQSGNATVFYKASGLMESTDNIVSDVASRLETAVKGMEGFKVLYPMSRDTGGDTGFTYGYYNAATGTVITVTVTVYNTIKDHTDSFIVMGILYDALNNYNNLGDDIKTFIDNYGKPVQEEHTHTAGDEVETVSDVVPATLDTAGSATVTTTVSCSECGEVLSTDTRVEEDLLTASDAVMYTFYYMTGKQYEVASAKLSDGTEVRYNALAFQASGVSCEYAMSIVDEVIQDYLGAPAYPMGATPTPTTDGGFQALYAYLNEYTGTFFAIQADIYPDVNASGTEITVVQVMAYLV